MFSGSLSRSQEHDDVLLTSYLATLTKTLDATNELVDRNLIALEKNSGGGGGMGGMGPMGRQRRGRMGMGGMEF